MAFGNRFSSLPIAQFCAKAPALSTGAGRAAAISSCFHARCAGDERWREMYARLSDEEQEEVDAMRAPDYAIVKAGGREAMLQYESARKEVPLGLTSNCSFVPKGHPDAMCEGTCDMCWILNRIAYVVDIKRNEYTAAEGPESIQVKGYALAVCAKHGDDVDGYVTGIYAAQEGTWAFADYIALDSAECQRDWERVKAAASNVDGDYATGPHCRGCYSRQKCPAYLVPPEHAHDGIAKYLSGEIDQRRALELLRFVERVEETCKTARGVIKACADMNGGIVDAESGKVYKPVQVSGRASLDQKALERDHPELVQKYTRIGKPFPQYRWTNGAK